jgi:hypothetical protein
VAVTAIAAFQRTLPELDCWLLAAGCWLLSGAGRENRAPWGYSQGEMCFHERDVDVVEKGEVGPGGEDQRPNQTRIGLGWGKQGPILRTARESDSAIVILTLAVLVGQSNALGTLHLEVRETRNSRLRFSSSFYAAAIRPQARGMHASTVYCRQRRHRSWPDRKILVIPVMQSPNKLEKVRLLLYMT